jgi:hypothetical protein
MSKRDDVIFFDYKKYVHDLRDRMKEVTMRVRDLLLERLKESVERLHMKTNKVRLAGGDETSDAKRRNALLSSIVAERVSVVEGVLIETAVSAMADNFPESHIGIYYEYGTGVYAEDIPEVKDLGDPNPYRTGKEIVSRSRKNGTWRDAGGNVRITGSIFGGGSGEKFREYIGEDIVPQHWFEKTFDEFIQNEAIPMYEKVISELSPFNYMKVKRKFVLGRD